MVCAFENAKMGFFTIGDIAIFEQSLAISSWIKDCNFFGFSILNA